MFRELAKRAGVDREHINQIEANKTKSMMLTTAERLARGMGIPPCNFFDENHDGNTAEVLDKLIEHIRRLK